LEVGQTNYLRNIYGQAMIEVKANNNKMQIDISKLAAGIYFVGSVGYETKKIIKF